MRKPHQALQRARCTNSAAPRPSLLVSYMPLARQCSIASSRALTDSEFGRYSPCTARDHMETTDAFRKRFEQNYYNLLIKKGIDPAAARTRAREKAAALPARIETPAAAAPAAASAPASAARPAPALVSREAPAQRADHVCTCLSGHPDRCSAPVHICACCTGNFAACRATAHNCNCTTMISLLSSTAIPCRAHLCGNLISDAPTPSTRRRPRNCICSFRTGAHVHRCRCDNPSHKCLSRVHKCICGTVLGKCLKHPTRKKQH